MLISIWAPSFYYRLWVCFHQMSWTHLHLDILTHVCRSPLTKTSVFLSYTENFSAALLLQPMFQSPQVSSLLLTCLFLAQRHLSYVQKKGGVFNHSRIRRNFYIRLALREVFSCILTDPAAIPTFLFKRLQMLFHTFLTSSWFPAGFSSVTMPLIFKRGLGKVIKFLSLMNHHQSSIYCMLVLARKSKSRLQWLIVVSNFSLASQSLTRSPAIFPSIDLSSNTFWYHYHSVYTVLNIYIKT